MSKTCQDVLTGAIALSDANQAFTTLAASEILARLQFGQGQLFTRLAQENRFFYVFRQVKASSNAGANRTVDLSTLVPPLERLLDKGVALPDGTAVNVVDFQDQDAELAPRAYPLGLVLNEVGAEWGATGPVNLTIVYAYRPADLDLAGALSQAITVPDRFSSWLEYDLAIYFNQKDIGRAAADPEELKRLTALQEVVFQDLLQYLDHVMGPAIRRFILPTSGATRGSDKA